MNRLPGIAALTDSSAYYAMSDRRETAHDAAVSIGRLLARERRRVYATNFILAECHALILIRLGYVAALRFLVGLDRGVTTVVRVTESDEQRAREIITTYSDKTFSYTDATSFAVMERLNIDTAFTLDRNFAQFGFVVLPNL